MKFKVGDMVTPGPAFIGYRNVFVVEEENLINRSFKIRLFADITNAEDNIPHNDITWREDELELIRTVESLKDASKNQFIEDVMEKTAVYYKENEGRLPSEFFSRNFGPEIGPTGGLTAPWTPIKTQNVKISSELLRIGKNLFDNRGFFIPADDLYPQEVKENEINKEENEMYKILDIYETREKRKINDLYDERIKSIIEDDEIQKIIKEMENQIKTVAGERAEGYCFAYPGLYEERTAKAIKELEQERDKKLKELKNKIIDIKAFAELAPNYEEKLKILRDYEIIDKKKNIIL